jgi:hypothetical protein
LVQQVFGAEPEDGTGRELSFYFRPTVRSPTERVECRRQSTTTKSPTIKIPQLSNGGQTGSSIGNNTGSEALPVPFLQIRLGDSPLFLFLSFSFLFFSFLFLIFLPFFLFLI